MQPFSCRRVRDRGSVTTEFSPCVRAGRRCLEQHPQSCSTYTLRSAGFVDWRLLLGDMVVVFATEASSDMIPLEQMPALTLTLAASWWVYVQGLTHAWQTW